jgi:hypothetical protein
MKKRFQNWRVTLSSEFPSASNAYWTALPLRRITGILAGAFLAGTAMGFVFNLRQLNSPPLGRVSSGLFCWLRQEWNSSLQPHRNEVITCERNDLLLRGVCPPC